MKYYVISYLFQDSGVYICRSDSAILSLTSVKIKEITEIDNKLLNFFSKIFNFDVETFISIEI